MVNFVNPFVFLVWLGIITFAKAEYTEAYQLGIFIAAVLSGILTTDVLKVLFAKKLKPFIQPHLLAKIYKIIGVILLVFASRLLWFAFFYKQIAYTGNFGKLYFNENGLLIRA